MDASVWAAIVIAVVSLLGLIATYFGFILRIEHRLTKLETLFEFVPFPRLLDLMQAMLNKIPPASPGNPYDRRGELMARLGRRELTYPEAFELRDLVSYDVERSNQDETVKALILIGLGILIGYALSRERER